MPTGVVASLTLTAPAGSSQAYAIDRSDLVLTLTLLQTSTTSPGTLQASVGNGTPGGTVSFFLDGQVTAFFTATLDDEGTQRYLYLPIKGLLVGTHTVRVSADALPPPAGTQANKDFTVSTSKDTAVVVPVTGTEPPIVDAPNRWVFQAYDFSDPMSVDTYILPVNPSRMARSFGNAPIIDEPTTVSTGKIVSWEGAPKPPVWSFEGSVLTKVDYREMVRWGLTKQRFYITDHFGHRYLVKSVDFEVTRVRDLLRPFNHTYRMTVNVLQGTGVFTL